MDKAVSAIMYLFVIITYYGEVTTQLFSGSFVEVVVVNIVVFNIFVAVHIGFILLI